MAGIYFHIPFCKRICAYCDFFRTAQLSRLPATLDAMRGELARRRGWLRGAAVTTRYFGGGTPSLCTPAQLGGLLRLTEELFDCSRVEETTLEANPDDLTPAVLAALREEGFDRLSIGIQSFDDDCLKLMNRRHTASQAAAAVRNARSAGFGNITVDLIFGVPGFGGESLRRTVDLTLGLEVEHLSAYHLTVEPATAFGRRQARGTFAQVDEQTSEREFRLVHDAFTAAGYEHYEVSNFARPGFRARHNAAYWHGVPYLGIGPAAHSYDGVAARHWNPASLEAYLAGDAGEGERLSERDLANEYLMTRLRTAEGIDLEEFGARFGERRRRQAEVDAARWIAAGTLRAERSGLRIPPERFLLSDAVICSLFDGGADERETDPDMLIYS